MGLGQSIVASALIGYFILMTWLAGKSGGDVMTLLTQLDLKQISILNGLSIFFISALILGVAIWSIPG